MSEYRRYIHVLLVGVPSLLSPDGGTAKTNENRAEACIKGNRQERAWGERQRTVKGTAGVSTCIVVFDGENPKYTCNKGTLRPWQIYIHTYIDPSSRRLASMTMAIWKSWLEW